MAVTDEMQKHLDGRATLICRCWKVTRKDGTVLGFTDSDGVVSFGGTDFFAETGLTARALSQTTGLSVDNSEAMGALTGAAISEQAILAGRFDGAMVEAWLVNWADSSQRAQVFSGSIGEITRRGGAFQAELRGLAEALNQAQGRAYQRPCSAILGDARCRFDVQLPGYNAVTSLSEPSDGAVFYLPRLPEFEPNWFDTGTLKIQSGDAAGLSGVIKSDDMRATFRRIELWENLKLPVEAGAQLQLIAGCDKRAETCRVKFSNFNNYQGFPHIPGEDWLISYPVQDGVNDGGSLQ